MAAAVDRWMIMEKCRKQIIILKKYQGINQKAIGNMKIIDSTGA